MKSNILFNLCSFIWHLGKHKPIIYLNIKVDDKERMISEELDQQIEKCLDAISFTPKI